MTKEELIETLRLIPQGERDLEAWHEAADAALLAYINDAEVLAAFDAIEKWYS